MSFCLRSLCQSFRSTMLRKVDLSRTIFEGRKPHLVPKTPELLNSNEWKIFYSFRGIKLMYAICSKRSLKLALCMGTTCVSIVAGQSKLLNEELCLLIASTALQYAFLLLMFSYFSQNLVGKMFTNKSMTQIVISSLNNRGERINKTFNVNQVTMTDHPNAVARKYVKKIICSGENEKYNLYYRQGVGVNLEYFRKIFPDFNEFTIKKKQS